jgi:hypothetical protein
MIQGVHSSCGNGSLSCLAVAAAIGAEPLSRNPAVARKPQLPLPSCLLRPLACAPAAGRPPLAQLQIWPFLSGATQQKEGEERRGEGKEQTRERRDGTDVCYCARDGTRRSATVPACRLGHPPTIRQTSDWLMASKVKRRNAWNIKHDGICSDDAR